MTSSLTFAQVSDQIHTYLREAVAALPGDASMTPLGDDVQLPCTDQDSPAPSTPISVRPAARLHGISSADYPKTLDSFVAYWTKHDWKISLDQRPAMQRVVVRNPVGYSLFLQVSDDGALLSIGAATPCVKPPNS